MPIRLEHQPSPYAVGLAGYAIGTGAARQRQQQQALGLFMQDRAIRERREEQFEARRYAEDRQDQRQQWMDDRDARLQWSEPPKLLQTPDWVDSNTQKRIAEIDAKIYGLRSGRFRHDDPNAQQAFQDLMQQREDIFSRLEAPDPGEQASRNWGYLNPKTGARAKMGEQQEEGMVLWDYGAGGPVYDDSGERAAAKLQQQAEERAAKAAVDDYDARYKETMRRLEANANAKSETGEIDYDELERQAAEKLGPRPSLPAAGGGESIPEFDVVPGGGVRPVTPRSGAPGGAAVREDGMIDLQTKTVPDWADEAWPDPIPGRAAPSSDRVAEVMPKLTAGMQQQRLDQFTPEMLRQARRIAQTPAGRAALQERYGVDFAMPDESESPESKAIREREARLQQAYFGSDKPAPNAASQHVAAQRAQQTRPQSGQRSDAEEVVGKILGSGSLAGREAARRRNELAPGDIRVTKYNVEPTADEREAAMNERYERAVLMARASGRDPRQASATTGEKPSLGDPMMAAFAKIQREEELAKRQAGVTARAKSKGISRDVRLGKVVRVTTEAQYNALPPGTEYVDPDGKRRRKA